MWDICRSFHPTRTGMFTCWNQKTNARPGNFGSRIDYVLCTEDLKGWFCDSDIQEGLMGSDHCPVYAVLKDKIEIDGVKADIRDIMSSGMFKGGVRQRQWSQKDLLPMSAKLIPEFDRRRSIRDMFTKKPALPLGSSGDECKPNNSGGDETPDDRDRKEEVVVSETTDTSSMTPSTTTSNTQSSLNLSPGKRKRPSETSTSNTPTSIKRTKSGISLKSSSTAAKGQPAKGQSSLMGFFKPKTAPSEDLKESHASVQGKAKENSFLLPIESPNPSILESTQSTDAAMEESIPENSFNSDAQESVIDPIVSKESWSKLLGKRVVPRCEHDEPCISYVTKKSGINMGRSFYICPRPLGPSGQKERNTQWRCGTFIWSSDWSGA